MRTAGSRAAGPERANSGERQLERMPAQLRRLAPLALPAAATLFLLSGPILGATTDDEEYRNTILSLVLHARAVLDGHYPYWTSALGFGLPHPLHPTFFFHPLMPVFGLWPAGTAVRALYGVHGVLGALGAWRLLLFLGAGRWCAGLGSATWVLATPALNYAITDFWLSNFVGWSLAPLLLLCGLRVLDDRRDSQPWLSATALGATAGFLTVNGHAGQQLPLFLPLAVMCLAHPRLAVRRFPALLFASLLGALIASPVVARLLMELPRFPGVPRRLVEVSIGWHGAVDLLVRPFLGMSGARVPFFGGPMLLLACAFLAGLGSRTWCRRGLAATFIVGLALVFLPNEDAPTIMSGTYAFRDPMVLAGIALASLALRAIGERAPRVAVVVGAAQLAVLVLSAYPFVSGAWPYGGASDPSVHHTSMTASLQQWRHRLPGRWYLAPQLDELVRRGSLYDDGLWRDTWVYHDLPVVNGQFKGISADTIYPSGTLPLGRIEGHPSTVGSAPMLNMMGIGAVLALSDEPVADSLVEVAQFDTHLGQPVRLLRNPGAWPGAGFVDAALLAKKPPTLENCRTGILCLDVSAIEASRPDIQLHLTREHGVLRASFAPNATTPRRLLVAEMYRPEWAAQAGGRPATVTSAWNGLVVVDVPPGAGTVELRYRPAVVIALTWASGLALLTSCVALAVGWARARRRVPQASAAGDAAAS